MQFREFGEWITRMTTGTDRYIVFCSMNDIGPLTALAKEAGVEDRFEFIEALLLKDPTRIYVVVEPKGYDVSVSVHPLGEALDAAIRADLKNQIEEERLDIWVKGGPGVFKIEEPDDAIGATHPQGEDSTGS